MKRIKAINGYTIMEVTARDEKQGNGTAGEYAIFFSSDIRDYGVAYSTPEYDGIGSLDEAEAICNSKDNVTYAKARTICEQESTAVTYEDIEQKVQELEKAEENPTDLVMDALKAMDASELVQVWNEYCYKVNRYDDEVFDMAMFNEVYANTEPEEIARRCFYGHDEYGDESSFNPNRAWFYFNGYGNPVSVEYLGWNSYADKFMGDCIDAEELAEYVAENLDSLYNDDLQEVVDRIEEVEA